MNELSIMVEWVALPCVLVVGVPHGRTSCTSHATKGQRVAPRWCHVFLHASGDSEIECLLEELDDGAFDDRVFLGKILVALFHIVVALTHNECTGVSCR
jgi:hypothetical protein